MQWKPNWPWLEQVNATIPAQSQLIVPPWCEEKGLCSDRVWLCLRWLLFPSGLWISVWLVYNQSMPLKNLAFPLMVHKMTETPQLLIPLTLHCWVKNVLPGSTHDSGIDSFGRALLPWWGVNVNDAMIRNLSLTLEYIAESTVKPIAATKILRLSDIRCFW